MYETDPNIKRKNRSPLRVIVNVWGCMLALVMLGLGAGLGVLAAIFVGPQLLGFDLTATAFAQRSNAIATNQANLELQMQHIHGTETAFAFDIESTQIMLNNEEELIGQTATQSAQNVIATHTASAVQDAQRRTQIANDFVATQAALEANATHVELDFRNTQAAMGIEVPTAQANLAATATPVAMTIFEMSEIDLNTTDWNVSNPDDWQVTNDGLVTLTNGAWITNDRLEFQFDDAYTVEFLMSPAATINADYWLIFSLGDDDGLAAHFHAETLTVTEVGMYRFDNTLLDDSNALTTGSMTVIQRIAAETPLTDLTRFSIQINTENDTVSLQIGDEALLAVPNLTVADAALGVQLPAQARLLSLAVKNE